MTSDKTKVCVFLGNQTPLRQFKLAGGGGQLVDKIALAIAVFWQLGLVSLAETPRPLAPGLRRIL